MLRQNKRITSPNGCFEAEFSSPGDDPLELNGAALSLSGLPFGTRTFDWHGVWSPCSRYFAVTEFRTADSAQGPDMHLVVIDVSAGQECVVERAERGFVEPISIRDGRIRYNKVTHDTRERVPGERTIAESVGWRDVSGAAPAAAD
jgi:hypothetical protein